jgi:dihydropyrimidinase
MKGEPGGEIMSSDCVLVGGTLVTPRETYQADIHIREGKIATIGKDLQVEGERRDVTGHFVMPGGIDTHVHLEHPLDRMGISTADDFESGTTAAACGGTTTIVDFALQRQGETIEQAVSRRRGEAEKSVIDYGLHVILTDIRNDILDEMSRFVNEGYTSYKIYMTFGDKRVDDEGLLKVLEQTATHGGLAFVHCENDAAVCHFTQGCLDSGETGPYGHLKSRPPMVEAEAAHRAISLAEMVGAPVCIAHVTSKDTLAVIEAGRDRGARVFGESCPQYLTLTDEHYQPWHGFEAAKFVCTPPLRDKPHLSALWTGLQRGSLHQVSSDHAPFRFHDQKQLGRNDFTRIPNGVPGIETRLPLVFSEGVAKELISVSRFVELVSANPAKLFGLYPQKGTLTIGADADLVVWDPDKKWEVTHEKLHHAVDYTPYEGMRLTGAPVLVLSRGEIVSENGEPRASRGRGRFVERRPEVPAFL